MGGLRKEHVEVRGNIQKTRIRLGYPLLLIGKSVHQAPQIIVVPTLGCETCCLDLHHQPGLDELLGDTTVGGAAASSDPESSSTAADGSPTITPICPVTDLQ